MFDTDELFDFRNKTFNKFNIINLTKENINSLKEDEVLFIEDSNDGETYILNSKLNIYYVNCEYGKELSRKDIFKVLKKYGDASYENPSVYTAINLGMGHALLIKTKIYDEYMKLLKSNIQYENQYEDCYIAYCCWLNYAVKYIKSKI